MQTDSSCETKNHFERKAVILHELNCDKKEWLTGPAVPVWRCRREEYKNRGRRVEQQRKKKHLALNEERREIYHDQHCVKTISRFRELSTFRLNTPH